MSHTTSFSQEPTPELLAPAGTTEAFWAALEAGADAVHCGLKAFNARALAKNFRLSEISDLTAAAHRHNRRLFVAVNALVKEREIPELIDVLAALET